MKYALLRLGLCLPISLLGCGWLDSYSAADAQVRGDRTLPRSSQVRVEGNRWIITEGTQRGTNLFHSFETFSVPENNTASFQEINSEIGNVFARVTGRLRSNINGTIEVLQPDGAISPANLFLLNPNGILFGPNARLNLGGSFIASSADRLRFADGTQFSATNPQASPLLTVSTPIGLQFGDRPGRIINRSVAQNFTSTDEVLRDSAGDELLGLRVLPGRTLALVGGRLSLVGGWLVAGGEAALPGGQVELASIAAHETVSLSPGLSSNSVPNLGGWNLGFSGVRNFDDIYLSQGAIVNTSGSNGGAIAVRGQTVRLTGGSQIFSLTQGTGEGGALVVNAIDRVVLAGSSDDAFRSSLYTATIAGGSAGDLQVLTRHLRMSGTSDLGSESFDAGRGGDVQIRAAETVDVIDTGLSNNTPFRTRILTSAFGGGAAGNLQISTGQLNIRSGGEVGSITAGMGRGGDVTINAADSVTITGISTISGLFDFERGGNLLAQTQAAGDNAGAAGNITIATDRLLLQNGGQIASSTAGSGNAGRLTVRASEIELTGIALDDEGSPFLSSLKDGRLPYPSGLFSGAAPGSTGNGRQLRVEADRLRLSDGAVLQTNTFGSGNAGNIIVRVADFIELNGQAPANLIPTGITAISGGFPGSGFREVRGATGSSGNIQIETGRLRVEDGAVVATSSINPAATGAGQLSIRTRLVSLSNNAQLNARTESGGRRSATIDLQDANLLTLQGGSQITTRAGIETGGGNGGAIGIQSRYIVAQPTGDNDISADAGQGNGGNVDITADIVGLVQQDRPTSPRSGITASSEQGISGTITLSSPEFDPTRGLLALPEQLTDTSRLIAQTCRPANPDDPQSTFVITGRGGLPPSPTDPATSESVITRWATLPEELAASPEFSRNSVTRRTAEAQSSIAVRPYSQTEIIEAQEIQMDDRGEIQLVAQGANTSPQMLSHQCPG
ncbi:beta strand repeat-containing protein [Leptolyngbya ohadii]|uniref:beta strand repeat-containing protein n=1 Tax=Leptolyngbya ohadii TaxID=1962290 RepID=UPI0015C67223|nr:S-layer family protein [Leptolyngbya ohadii]